MKGDRIPDPDHVARYCKPMQVSDEQIQATAFMLRSGEESLSVNWLEFLECPSRECEIDELQKTYAAKLNIGLRARIAILSVGEVRRKVLEESPDRRKIDVLHDPEEKDPSHSGIYNLRNDDELIAELILQTVRESYIARIPKKG